MALSPLLLAPLRLPAKALDGLPGSAPSTNPEPYVTGLRGGAPPGPRHQERKRAGLPSRRHYRFSKQRRQVYEPGGALRVKVRRKLRNWFSAGASLEVLKWIKHGVRIEWKEGKRPAPFHQGRSFAGVSPEERAFVLSEVDRLLDSGAIRVAEPGEATHVSKAFLVPKGDKFRMIWDGRKLNESVVEKHLEFETLKTLKHLARQGDWMLQVDLSDGFHILGIDFRDQPAMSWQCAITGQTYLYQVLPFGYKLSPYAFCRAMETFTRVLRSPDLPVTGRGTPEALLAAITSDLKQSRLSSAQAPLRMRILPYMDDYLALFPSQEEAVRGAVQMKTTLAFLGLEANPKKCVWTPTQELQHLGIVVNTKLAVFLVPQEKERKLVSFALGILRSSKRNRRLFSRRQLAAFTGLAQSIALAVPVAPLYLRALHDCTAQGRDWNCNVRLTRQAIRDLQWWADLSKHNLGRQIWRSPAQHQLHSDASTFAWGGVLDDHSPQRVLAHGLWTVDERQHHITILELLAVTRNLMALNVRHRLKGKSVHLHEDNQAVCYILRRKTSRSPVLMEKLRELWHYCEEMDCTLRSVSYVRSADNPADAPSRITGSDSWRLDPSRLADLGIQLHLHTVDRFASADNCLLPRYNSLHADPRAEAEDCYSQDWSKEVNWCHPPINCLDQLAHFLRESPAAATVVAPYWPGKAWFRELLTLAGDYRLIGTAAALADQQYLSRFKLRPPGAWPLVTFVIRA